MGKRGNKARQTRRSIEAGVLAKVNPNSSDKTQETLELEKAYGEAIVKAERDGEFTSDIETGTAITIWEPLEDEEFSDDGDDLISLIDKFRVIIEQDHLLEYPMLNLSIFVAGSNDEEAEFTEMLVRSGCTKAHGLDDADLCIFVGGADVDPQLYGAARWNTTQYNPSQDNRDMDIYAYCLSYGIPMVGVCRGAQFLHVMNGGQLFQDIDNHQSDHPIYCTDTGTFIQKTPSVHHQACMPNPKKKMAVLATANMAQHRRFWSSKDEDFIDACGNKADIEAFFYPDTCCLGFQGHPEYSNYPAYTIWCLQKIVDKIRHNHELKYSDDGAVLRLRPEILKQRMTTLETDEVVETKEVEVN